MLELCVTAPMLHLQETVDTAAEFNCDLARRAAAEEVLQPEVDVPIHRQLPAPLPAIVQACMGPAAIHAADGEAGKLLALSLVTLLPVKELVHWVVCT